MSDNEDNSEQDEKPFLIEKAKQGRAVCKKCKQKCPQGELRIAKLQANPFGEGKMKSWHHVACLFETFLKQRKTTKRLENPLEDLDGWHDLNDAEKTDIIERIEDTDRVFNSQHGVPLADRRQYLSPSKKRKASAGGASPKKAKVKKVDDSSNDDKFSEFIKLIENIAEVSSYTEKTKLVHEMFTKGSAGNGFTGDIALWCRLLLPGVVKRVYNLQTRQLLKLFSRLFNANHDKMVEHSENGDISDTIQHYFKSPAKQSSLTLTDVDQFLEELSQLTKEDEQLNHFKSTIKKCTALDLRTIIRLVKHDLRMNAGAKHILDGVHPDAYQAYQTSRDLDAVISRCLSGSQAKLSAVKAKVELMTPVLPMLAEACKSVEQAMSKCPNGMYSEIKYDGERVQVHKSGMEFKYFSRSLKPVQPHKIKLFKDFIPQAFPNANDLILDSEILMVDNDGKPLPFGSLGAHKKNEFKDATVCLFVFDCIYLNGESLIHKSLKFRKNVLKDNMQEIKNHIMFSEMKEIHKPKDLASMIAKVLQEGLEGLVLKDIESIYEPGKRHWLKVKKDYLFGGAMADSADLIVLGAWYGTGKKGGMMSVFLMGCYDPYSKIFRTVTKVHTGHDDKTLERLQDELDMVKISMDPDKVPDWLDCTRTMVPDFVARDPKKQPVWEITGAEFTKHDVHTADGISIRFPRVTKIRDDKDWKTATNLEELKTLFKNSKESTDVSLLINNYGTSSDISKKSPSKKQKTMSDFITKNNKNRNKKMKESEDSDNESNKCKAIIDIQKPLPNFFDDIRIIIDENVRKLQWDVIRHFIAFGGLLLLPEKECLDATHVIHSENTVKSPKIKTNSSARHVNTQWIIDSINARKVLDTKAYAVKWNPN